jgi:CubicO group peptidase (beta-lactamase class C family)
MTQADDHRAATTPATLLPTTAAALLHRVATAQTTARVPALIAGVMRDGALVWSGARGQVDGTPPDADTQFRIGSITKTMTAVLVARLRDEGRLDFADPLDRHLPGTPFGDRTIAQLLSHSAGLQAEREGVWWERTPGTDWAGLAATFSERTVRHPAGRRHHYSNPAYAVLGEVVARKRGTSWWDAVRTEILAPLGMRRTTYAPVAPHASGFAVHPWADVVLPEPAHDVGAMAPAGQLWSTVADLARWAAFAGGDTGGVLSTDTLAEMQEPQAIVEGTEWTSGHGYGWGLVQRDGRRLVGHTGSMPGFVASLHTDPDAGVGAVVLANTTSGLVPGALTLELVTMVVDREPRLPAAWTPVADLPREVLDIVGPWYWGPAGFVLTARGTDELRLAPLTREGPPVRFRPNPDGTWTGLDGYFAGETLRVVRDADGQVSHLDLGTFVFTQTPYDEGAPIPGGVEPGGWTGTS